MQPCLPCLPCLPVYLSTCLPCLPCLPPVYPVYPVYLSTCLPDSCLPVHPFLSTLSTCLPVYLSTTYASASTPAGFQTRYPAAGHAGHAADHGRAGYRLPLTPRFRAPGFPLRRGISLRGGSPPSATSTPSGRRSALPSPVASAEGWDWAVGGMRWPPELQMSECESTAAAAG